MTTIEVPPARREAARELSIASRGRDAWKIYTHLIVDSHEDLGLDLSTDSHWFHLVTPDGYPAVWDVLWLKLTGASDDMESPDYAETEVHECGTFYDMRPRLAAIIDHPRRVPGSAVDCKVNEWALHFQLPILDPAPDCLRTDPRH
jgi:hypothetical protein